MSDQSFDLDVSTQRAWDAFAERLGEVLSMMDEDSQIVISSMAGETTPAPAIRFRGGPGYRLFAEAAGNAELAARYQLGEAQRRLLASLGWTAVSDLGAGQDRYLAEGASDDSFELARLAVETFRRVYGIEHPVFLEPDQLSEILQPPPPPLVTTSSHAPKALVAVLPVDQQQLDQLLDAEMQDIYGQRPYRDAQGDIAIRVGSTMVFARSAADAREVLLFSVLVHDVAGRSRATEVLNDLNAELRFGKFSLHKDRVFVQMSIPAHPFVPAHLHQALAMISQIADGIDDELAARLQGRTTFDPSS